jgi:hypothetical protein
MKIGAVAGKLNRFKDFRTHRQTQVKTALPDFGKKMPNNHI